METAVQIVAIARDWIGTPYRHQASVKGAGCDCLGLVRGVWREMHGDEPEVPPAYSMDWSEPQGEERLLAACRAHLRSKPVDEEGAGDGADAGSGTFTCGRGDAWEEIWAIRESTVSSWVGATSATVAPEPLGVGMVKICVE